jgi:hypothetical protein
MPDPNLPLLEDAVHKLAPFLDEIVFVGVITLGLPLPLNMLWADMMRESPHMPNLCRVRMLHS